jgi:hypothetical protein
MARFNESDDLWADLEDSLGLYEYGIDPLAMNEDPSAFQGLPKPGARGRAEAVQYSMEAYAEFNPDTAARRSDNYAASTGGIAINPMGDDLTEAADSTLNERPTATSMPSRPRTVAANYDPARQVLTLVFRDGTYYNYYGVSMKEWETFRNLPSKWQYIRDVLDKKGRGMANDASDPTADALREATYIAARIQQRRQAGRTNISQMSQAIKNKPNPKYPGRNPNQSAGKNPNRNAGRRGR